MALTDKQTAALATLKANGKAVLHVKTGGVLVNAGHATKLATTGHGKLMAEYQFKGRPCDYPRD
jgi:hypothetical protein